MTYSFLFPHGPWLLYISCASPMIKTLCKG